MSPTPSRPVVIRAIALGNRVIHRLSGGRYGSLEPGKHAPRGRVLALITKLHRRLYRWTGGLVGGDGGGLATLLLTTTGRKTGQPRTVPLPYFPHRDGYIVVASFAGGPKNPAWYENLVARPEVGVQIRRRRLRATARVLQGDERAASWAAIVAAAPIYEGYQAIAPREIPLVVLQPVA